MHLSVHQGGTRPDRKGDKGRHFCRYAILPLTGGFGATRVIQPAYMCYLERNAKLPLFVEKEDLVMYRENPDKSISKLLELIREFSKIV